MSRHRKPAFASSVIAILAVFVLFGSAQGPSGPAGAPRVQPQVRDNAVRHGKARVIVELKLPSGMIAEGQLQDRAAVVGQRQAIAAGRDRVLARMAQTGFRVVHRYESVPYVALEVSAAALAVLENSGDDVASVLDDAILRPSLAESVPVTQADQVWAGGYDGAGTVVAVLDSGVDASHPFLGGKVVEEACYSSTVDGVSQSFCPNGLGQQIGAGAAAPCPLNECMHGTHVAGIAAGNGDAAGQPFSGVAKSAKIMAVQVFSKVLDAETCGGVAPCMGGFTSDIIAALERVYAVALAGRNIASVNMSLGGGSFAAPCDAEPYKPSIDNLRSIGIASVVASGNGFQGSTISTPACVSSAVSVGSTTNADDVSLFSNVAPFLSLFAPGENINASVPGGGYLSQSGTSMAAPHVAGGWALIRQAAPAASVNTILAALRNTGRPVTDGRLWAPGTTTVPRVRIFQGLASIASVTSPSPSIASVTPMQLRTGAPATLVVLGEGFNALSVVRWNGAPTATTVRSAVSLEAVIPAADLAVGTALVSVFNPAPGGGTSSQLPVVVEPGPALKVSATTVGPSSGVTVTLEHGFGGAKDWIALASTAAGDRTYLQWIYVGTGVTATTWTTTMPATAGTYEFRLFLNNGYTRAATSPTVTVDPSLNPLPAVTSLSPSLAPAGTAGLALVVNGAGFVASSVVRWNGVPRPTTFVSSVKLQATIGASDLANVGTAQVSAVNPAPGGGTSPPVPFTITPPPSLAISASHVDGGASETVTLTGGLGGATDWLALASTASPNTTYLQWIYVGAGVTTRTWTVTMPTVPGTYEFRLFLNKGYTRAATSPTVTVNPLAPSLTSISPASLRVGGSFTLTATGSGFTTASVVHWKGAPRPSTYVSATQLRASIPGSDLVTAGTASVTVVTPPPGGGVSSAKVFTIIPLPSLTVSATSVPRGAAVTVMLADGYGGATDWLALASTSAGNNSYIQWVYVGSGLATKAWTVTMPATPGTYEFRLFLSNGYTRAATSLPVTVSP